MLDSLDLLIGFTVVMLTVSLAVTVITQYLSSLLNIRGVALRQGIADLLVLIAKDAADLEPAQAWEIADKILRDPVIASSHWFGAEPRAAGLILREEFTRLLLINASNPTDRGPGGLVGWLRGFLGLGGQPITAAAAAPPGGQPPPETWQTRLTRVVTANGVEDPAAVLAEIRKKAMELEHERPELSNSLRASLAILAVSKSDLVGKIHNWFDQTMDRVGDDFTSRTRIVTVIVAVALATVLQLDSFRLINQLSINPTLRAQLVARAADAAAQPPPGTASAATPPPVAADAAAGQKAAAGGQAPATLDPGAATKADEKPAAPAPPKAAAADRTAAKTAARTVAMTELAADGFFALPTAGSWRDQLDAWEKRWRERSLVGVLISVLLLSLGAPFWYESLKNLLNLRSLLAPKEEAQRKERQTTQPAN